MERAQPCPIPGGQRSVAAGINVTRMLETWSLVPA